MNQQDRFETVQAEQEPPDEDTTHIDLESSQEIISDGILISEVIQIIKGESDVTIEELNQDALQVVLEVWRKNNKEDTSVMKTMNRNEMISELVKAKRIIENPAIWDKDDDSNADNESDEEINRKVDAIFETVKQTNINAETTDEEITAYSHIQRARFVYSLHLKRDGRVVQYGELIESTEQFIIDRLVKEWRDQQKSIDMDTLMEESSIDEDKLYPPTKTGEKEPASSNISPTPSNITPTSSEIAFSATKEKNKDTDEIMKDPPEDVITPIASNIVSPPPKSIHPMTEVNTINKHLTNMFLQSMSKEAMQDMLHQYYKDKGSSITKEMINVYSREYIIKTIQELRDKDKTVTQTPNTSNLKQKPKYTKPVQADLKMKTQ